MKNKDYETKNIKCGKCGSNRIRIKATQIPKCTNCGILIYGVHL